MATLATAGRDAACNAVVDLIDQPGGAGSGTGRLRITDTNGGGGTTLVDLPLNTTAFGNSSTGVATLVVSPAISAAASAGSPTNAAGFLLQADRSGTPTTIISGSVGTSGTDIIIDNVSITSGQTINLNSMTVTVPASP